MPDPAHRASERHRAERDEAAAEREHAAADREAAAADRAVLEARCRRVGHRGPA